MSKVPRISGNTAVKAFKRAGWKLTRVSGSHHILHKDGIKAHLNIPVHDGKTVGTGLLSDQIKTAGLTVEQFIELL